MNKILLPLLMLLSATITACAAREQVYNSLYEGLQTREQLVNAPLDPVPKEHPRYDEYKRERDEILSKDKTESDR